MPGPWITDADLTEDVAASMQFDDSTQMGVRWVNIINAANNAAASDLTQFLTGLGYTLGQIDEWDDRVQANRRLGLLYALQRGNPLGKIDPEMAKNLDPRQGIKDQGGVSIGGVPTTPTAADSQIGGISSGRLLAATVADLESRRWSRWLG